MNYKEILKFTFQITPESVCNFKIPETSNDDLLKMIQNDIYPPNFVISTWPGSNSVTTILKVSFVGAENELKVEIKLSLDEPGMSKGQFHIHYCLQLLDQGT